MSLVSYSGSFLLARSRHWAKDRGSGWATQSCWARRTDQRKFMLDIAPPCAKSMLFFPHSLRSQDQRWRRCLGDPKLLGKPKPSKQDRPPHHAQNSCCFFLIACVARAKDCSSAWATQSWARRTDQRKFILHIAPPCTKSMLLVPHSLRS